MDQTQFIEDQSVLMPPPGTQIPSANAPGETPPPVAKKPNKKILILAILLAITLVLGLLTLIILFSPGLFGTGTGPIGPVATPDINIITPSNTEPTELSKQLQSIKTQIDNADPSHIDVNPPPLDFKLTL